ncbi:hypothetical protein [Kosakonia pseudosacchari]|uniref:Tail fiber assembly protein n=1 Tax=Kosakonia pseudosacchari TaxID=1646340 RepID=A0ABX4IJF1_9ENTR|nr:hypothetical protein [Kosakonia pseudosacchari]PDO83344.1 hypothetical protein BK796_20430 [Kosakonia pseudosacchari]
MKYLFSDTGFFYPFDYKERYVKSGNWPEVGVEVEESVFLEFIGRPPEGKVCGKGPDGMPAWVDAPPPILISDYGEK